MSRRRYISTNISLDPRVNKLATLAGDFAALLYTWMIPHAGDDGTITNDPEELLFMVLPGRRDKTAEDVEQAIAGMAQLGLVEFCGEMRCLRFPASSWFKYQTYIPEKKRVTPQNAAEHRTSPEKAASLSPSPSLSLTPSTTPPVSPPPTETPRDETAPPVAAPPPEVRTNPKVVALKRSRPKADDDRDTSRFGQVIATLVQLGVPSADIDRERTAAGTVNRSTAPVAEIAECYALRYHGLYGSERDRQFLSFKNVVSQLSGYRPWRRTPEGEQALKQLDAVARGEQIRVPVNGYGFGRAAPSHRQRIAAEGHTDFSTWGLPKEQTS